MAHAAGNIAQVVKLAFISRVLLVVLALLFDAFTEDYDTSALINPPCLTTSNLHISELTGKDKETYTIFMLVIFIHLVYSQSAPTHG